MLENSTLPRFDTARVIVYGDLMLDRYWCGTASRISPEAPVPVINVNQKQVRPGGAANVAINIAALSGQVSLFGYVGQDLEADELRSYLTHRSISCQFLSLPDYPTITKLRVLGQNQQLVRVDFEQIFVDVDAEPLINKLSSDLDKSHVVVLSDYAKGTLQNIDRLIALAKERGLPVLVDPKSTDFKRYSGATLVTPNRKEFEAMVGPCRDEQEIVVKARKLIADCQIDALLVTCGKDGMVLVTNSGNVKQFVAHARDVFDVTGAGDTVIAVIAASLAAGETLENSVALANIAAGIVVGKLGTATVSVPELRRALQRRANSSFGVLTEDELSLAISDARAHGETVVMTNGCFDVLHAGHVQYLEEAKTLGKRLVVAINDDQSVKRLKGDSRPINSLEERMVVITALRAVDWVVPFSEDTPERLIKRMMPDVLVKANDYQVSEIAGADAVLANGGDVQTLALRKGCSTSAIIDRILEV